MALVYSSEVGVHGTSVCFYFILELVDAFEGGFSVDLIEVFLLKFGCVIVDCGGHV